MRNNQSVPGLYHLHPPCSATVFQSWHRGAIYSPNQVGTSERSFGHLPFVCLPLEARPSPSLRLFVTGVTVSKHLIVGHLLGSLCSIERSVTKCTCLTKSNTANKTFVHQLRNNLATAHFELNHYKVSQASAS